MRHLPHRPPRRASSRALPGQRRRHLPPQRPAEAILRPIKSIAQGFATNVFALDDGRTVTGFVTLKAADAVRVRTADGQEVRIPTRRIEDRAQQEVSLMPQGLVGGLTVPEFASLLDDLESLAGK